MTGYDKTSAMTDHPAPPWNVLDVFGRESDVHTCCECNGWTDLAGLPEDVTLFRGERAGVAYLTDRHLAIRDDLVTCPPEDVLNPQPPPSLKAFQIPEAVPGPSTILLRPWIVRRLTSVGVTVHASDDWKAQHLYLGTEHVGWLAGIRDDTDPELYPAMTLADIDIVRTIAARTVRVRDNMDTWDDAALTLAQVRYWRTKVNAWVSDPGLCGGKVPNRGTS